MTETADFLNQLSMALQTIAELRIENHANFHAEKADLLEAGIASGKVQTDDVGTRHCSKNCYTNVICNEYFVFLTTIEHGVPKDLTVIRERVKAAKATSPPIFVEALGAILGAA